MLKVLIHVILVILEYPYYPCYPCYPYIHIYYPPCLFVPTSVLIHVSVPDNKGVPRAPISQGITLLDNSPEFPPKLDQTQRIPAYPISFCHSTQETFCHSAQENFSTVQLQRLLSTRMFHAWTDFETK